MKINKKALIISLLLALAGAILLYQYLSSVQKPVAEKPKITILTAVRSFNPGDEVQAADIIEKKVDPDSVGIIGFTSREQIVGKIVKLPILTGEVFAPERLATREEMQLSFLIPEGKRALNLFVNESVLFSDLIQVGDRVDIVVNFSGGDEEIKIKPFVATILQNIEVLAIGTEKIKDNPGKPDVNNLAKTITLAFSPEEAEKMLYASSYGQYNIVLRKKGDNTKHTSGGIILDDLAPQKARIESGE